jgi:hypothetical protein
MTVIFAVYLIMLVPSFLVAEENNWTVEMHAPCPPARSLSQVHMYCCKWVQYTSIATVWYGYYTFTSSPGIQVDNLLVCIFSGLQGVILAYILNRVFR